MHVTLAAWVLALAGQVAQPRYFDAPANSDQPAPAASNPAASPAPAAGSSELAIPADSSAHAATPDAATSSSPDAPAAQPPTDTSAAGTSAVEPATIPFQPPFSREQAPTVAPVQESPPESSVLAASGPKPSEVIRSLIKAPALGRLVGQEITLSDAVRDARSRQDQTQRAKAYWDLSTAVGEYYVALLEQNELAILREGLSAPGEHWNVHEQQAKTRVESTRRAALAAQLGLHQLLGRQSTAPLPLPGDAPHCGRYNAEYDEIFASRPDPVARELSALMPLRYTELRAQAQAIAEAEAWRAEVRQLWTSARDDHQLLNAQDLVSLKRRAFLATARDYNQEIAAYTELAAPAEVAPDRLVAMMIRTSTSGSTAFRTPLDIQPATATDAGNGDVVQQAGGGPIAVQPQSVDPTTAKTPADPQRTVARRPIRDLFNNGEHSILSRIRRLPRRILDRD